MQQCKRLTRHNLDSVRYSYNVTGYKVPGLVCFKADGNAM